jgi:hypothetical protein
MSGDKDDIKSRQKRKRRAMQSTESRGWDAEDARRVSVQYLALCAGVRLQREAGESGDLAQILDETVHHLLVAGRLVLRSAARARVPIHQTKRDG